MDVDLYSSTKYIFDVLKEYIDTDLFDELVNYPGFDGEENSKHFMSLLLKIK